MLPSKAVGGTAITPVTRLLIAAGSALGALVLAAGANAASPGSLRTQADVLRARQSATIKAEQTALLDLYSLETALGRARAELASLRGAITSLRRQEASARKELVIARSALKQSETALGQTLRILYERSEPNAIAVLLGSESLDAALTQFDTLDRSARDNRRIISQTLAARKRAAALTTRLHARQTTLHGAEQRQTAAVSRLAQSRTSRAAYIRSLRVQRHLATARIVALEVDAAAAERTSRLLAAQARARQAAVAAAAKAKAATGATGSTSTAAAPPTPASPAPSTVTDAETPAGASLPADGASAAASAGSGDRTLTVTVTAYTLRGRTATGIPTSWGIVAVDPNVIPLGTRMTIPGYGEAIAADTGPGVRGRALDVWVPDYATAIEFGRRTVTIVLH